MKLQNYFYYFIYLLKLYFNRTYNCIQKKYNTYKKELWIKNYLKKNPECIYRNACWAYNRHLDSLNLIQNNFNNNNIIYNVKDELKHLSVPEIKEYRYNSLNKLPMIDVFLFGTKNESNLGTMIRTSELFGINKVWISNCKKLNSISAVGANKYINYDFISILNESDFIEFIKQNNYYCIIIEQGGFELQNFNFNNIIYNDYFKPLIIFGNESFGIPQYILNSDISNKVVISIPQLGVLKSLNVSVSHAIIIWEIQKCILLSKF